MAREKRFKVARFLVDHGVKALVNVPIRGADSKPPYGILEVDSRKPRQFTKTDTDFLRTYANLLAEAIERIRILRELRLAVADKDRLLRELQHRVKNNLQMVTSFVRLQERRARSAEARRELLAGRPPDRDVEPGLREALRRGRDRARGPGHLSRGTRGSLLRLHAEEAPGVRLRTDVESLVVPVDKAVPLGLIVNEFVTNSFKYAFQGEPGTIGLELARAEAGKARLRLWDDGQGHAAGARGRHRSPADRGLRAPDRRHGRLGGRRRHAADGRVRPVNRMVGS